jgi:hypothetical protein
MMPSRRSRLNPNPVPLSAEVARRAARPTTGPGRARGLRPTSLGNHARVRTAAPRDAPEEQPRSMLSLSTSTRPRLGAVELALGNERSRVGLGARQIIHVGLAAQPWLCVGGGGRGPVRWPVGGAGGVGVQSLKKKVHAAGGLSCGACPTCRSLSRTRSQRSRQARHELRTARRRLETRSSWQATSIAQRATLAAAAAARTRCTKIGGTTRVLRAPTHVVVHAWHPAPPPPSPLVLARAPCAPSLRPLPQLELNIYYN